MSVQPIRIVGDPLLHHRATDVVVDGSGAYSGDTDALIIDMFDTLDASGGVGLSANQIGSSARIFVYDCPQFRGRGTRRRGVLVNPVLQRTSASDHASRPDIAMEGCLSVPGLMYPTPRATSVRVRGLDHHGQPVIVHGDGFFARMLQHEIGHLDGTLYVDVLAETHRRAAHADVSARGWGVPHRSWTPGVDIDPFGSGSPGDGPW